MISSAIALVLLVQSTVTVDGDDVVIDRSAEVVVRAAFVRDANENGVVQITGDNIVVDFAGRTLRGADATATPDSFVGIGIRITGTNVTLKNAVIAGFKCGIWASAADGLTLEHCDVSDNFAQRLKSTPKAEDGSDWLWPHRNDEREWMRNYGAGAYIERSTNVTVRHCRARRTQNGLLLDRVTRSRIYDNDFSFLSGWGLGMWRCEDTVVSRNALDFCIRGYSHGVYNRGQDSAGILFFEQNHRNVLVENSATHGGDGFFGFAGREALGEVWRDEQREMLRKSLGPAGIRQAREDLIAARGAEWAKRSNDDVLDQQIVLTPETVESFRRRGNCDNILADNDFSYAAAHGVELTFSFGNWILNNRLVENAICGVWGGYSQETVIRGNTIAGNGAMGYGAERGGVNIEHGRANIIHQNVFRENRCGVHLWWDADEDLLKLPWTKANGGASADNLIIANTFDGDDVGIQLRATTGTIVNGNRMTGVKHETDAPPDSSPLDQVADTARVRSPSPAYSAIGDTRPVGARPALRGRDKIIMTEWGPYDWEKPYVQRLPADDGPAHAYRVLAVERVREVRASGPVSVRHEPGSADFTVEPQRGAGVAPYELTVETDAGVLRHRGVLVDARWSITAFACSADPRERPDAWKNDAARGVTFEATQLDLRFGGGGPADVAAIIPSAAGKLDDLKAIGRDRFGIIARTSLAMPAGAWRLTVTSDDGVRVYVDDVLLIDDWTWHPPKTESKQFTLDQARMVFFLVEHFELDGHAVLSLVLEPVE